MRLPRTRVPVSLLVASALALAHAAHAADAQPPTLKTAEVRSLSGADVYSADGQVEAVRQTIVAAQVPGRVTTLAVRAGDSVKAGQLLVRIDARAAEQNQAASAAQLAAARAQLTAADRSLERTRQLVAQKFLSPSALDRAEAEQRAAAESVKALTAQTAGAATQTAYHTVVAPFDAVVTSVTTELGDTALPGKPLLQLHDPSALRIAANVPATVAARIDRSKAAAIEIPDAVGEARRPTPGPMTVVAAADPVARTQLVRIDLDRGLKGLTPGLFARVRLPLVGDAGATGPVAAPARMSVPRAAVVVRGDLQAVYVVDAAGVATLRQVRLGRGSADEVEVLAGVSPGERVALDPVAAARVSGQVKK